MMDGYGNGMSGWGYMVMIAALVAVVGLVVVVGLVATGVLVLIRSAARPPAIDPISRQEAERILEPTTGWGAAQERDEAYGQGVTPVPGGCRQSPPADRAARAAGNLGRAPSFHRYADTLHSPARASTCSSFGSFTTGDRWLA